MKKFLNEITLVDIIYGGILLVITGILYYFYLHSIF